MAFDLSTAEEVEGFDLSTAKPVETVSPFQTYYRQDTGKIIEAETGLEPKKVEFLDEVQNNKAPKSGFFGFHPITDYVVPALATGMIAMKKHPKQVLRGAASSLEKMSVETAGGLLREAGETLKQRREKGASAIGSFADMVMPQRKALFDIAAAVPNFAELMTSAGKGLIEKNNKLLDDLGLSKQKNDGFAFDVGSGFGSVGTAVATTVITKNPIYAAALFGAYHKTQIYEEARKAQTEGKIGGGAEEAGRLSTLFAIPEAAIELFGGRFMLGVATSKPFMKIVQRSLGEAAQEGSQQASEETLAMGSGLRPVDISEALWKTFYSASIGAIVGAPIHTVNHFIETKGKEEGLTSEEIDRLVKKYKVAEPKLQQVAADTISDESSPLTDDPEAQQKVKELVADFKAGKQIEQPTDLSAEDAEAVRVISESVMQQEVATLPDQAEAKRNLQAGANAGRIKYLDDQVSGIDDNIVDVSEKIGLLEAEQARREKAIKGNLEVRGVVDAALQEKLSASRRELLSLSRQREKMEDERGELLDIGIARPKQDVLPSVDKREDIVQWLVKKGGVADYGGEVKYGGKHRGLINPDGIKLDFAVEMAMQEGFLPEGSEINDLLDAIRNTLGGQKILREHDMLDQSIAEGQRENLTELNEMRIQIFDEIKAREFDKLRRFTKSDIDAIASYSMAEDIDFNDALDMIGAAMDKTKDMPVAEILDPSVEGESRKMTAAGGDKVLVTASKLDTMRQRIRDTQKGFREGAKIARQNVKAAQEYIIGYLDKSGLSAEDKAKFIKSIKNIQNETQFRKQFPIIQSRVMKLMNTAQKDSLIAAIRKMVASAKKSSVIAIDFAKQIEALFSEIDTKKRSDKTLDKLQKTLEYMAQNPDAEMPKSVLKKLEILNRKPIGEVSNSDLREILDEMRSLMKQGRVKLALMKAQQQRIKQERLADIMAGSVPLNDTPQKRMAIGERLSLMDRIKNKFIEKSNRAHRISLALNPMDVFFDMLDGDKSYRGANHRIFKQTIDRAFSKYLKLKEVATREVKNLTDELNLSEQSFERIGVYATAQQEGGREKLLFSGITSTEIDGIKLTKEEMQMYELMRSKLDSMLPAIKEIMRVVYNKDVTAVKDYFPFMTDHEAMKDFEIQDQLGDAVPTVGRQKNVQKGFTETRTLGKQKVRIDALSVFLKHMDNAAYLIEMGADIKALGELAITPEYEAAVGDIGQEMVVEWVTLLARRGNSTGRIHMIDALRRNVGFAVLGFKLSSILVQPTALADGAALVGGSYVSRGVFDTATKREWRQFLKDNFSEIRERAGDDPAYLDMGGDGIVGEVRKASFWALKNVDLMAASAVAAGAYTKSVEERGGKVDLKNPDPVAIEEAQLMMRRTQSSGFAKDIPAMLSQGELTGNISTDKLIFQFQSFMLNRWSLIKHDMWAVGVKKGNTAQALNMAAWLLLANAAEYGVRELGKEIINAITGDDDEKKKKKDDDSITEKVATQLLSNVPFVSQAISTFKYGSIPVPALGLLSQVGAHMKWAGQSKSDEKKLEHMTSAAMLAAGGVLGVAGAMQAEAIFRKSTKEDKRKKSTP